MQSGKASKQLYYKYTHWRQALRLWYILQHFSAPQKNCLPWSTVGRLKETARQSESCNEDEAWNALCFHHRPISSLKLYLLLALVWLEALISYQEDKNVITRNQLKFQIQNTARNEGSIFHAYAYQCCLVKT